MAEPRTEGLEAQVWPLRGREEERLAQEADQHMEQLSRALPPREVSLAAALRSQGVSRREFLKWSAFMAATMGLPPSFDTRVARAAELAVRLPVIWQELQSCTGNSEALVRNANPSIDTIILELLSLEYAEVLMAAAGYQAEEVLEQAIARYRGKYIAVFEGSVPLGEKGHYLTIGPHGQTGAEITKKIAQNALVVINAGTCAAFGGIPMAAPNPTGAMGVQEFLRREGVRVPVINLPGCPVNSINIVGTILEYVLFGRLPQLDAYGRPLWAYGQRIHDKCERRGHFDAGEFVEGWNDLKGLKEGYCLYKVGCKGPFTYNNCGVVRYNQGTSWPIQVGRGCIGCSEPGFWDTMTPFEAPVAKRVYRAPALNDATADRLGSWALGLAGAGIAVHAALTALRSFAERKAAVAKAEGGKPSSDEDKKEV